MDSKSIGKIVYTHRKKSGLTQKKLADIAGVGKTVVYDIEKGKETVQLNTLLKILSALNIKIKFNSPLMKQLEINNEES
ncbi:MAG: helix-turn-helix transcriptional regulator [Ignavibacteriaceae bacterium]|jgi:y4mF family transcriptional regulator